MRKTILFLLSILLISFVSGVDYETGTKWHYGNASFDVTYTLNTSLTLDNLTIYDTGVIINSTNNVSITPSTGTINITLLSWNSETNSFTMIGEGQNVSFDIKVSGVPARLRYNNINYNGSFIAGTSQTNWLYHTDTIPPDDVLNLQAYDKSTSYVRLNWTNPTATDHNHTELWHNKTGTGLTFVTNLSKTTTSYTVSDLIGATEYTFQLRPVDNYDNRGNYSRVTSTTLESEGGGSGIQGGSGGGSITTTSGSQVSNLYLKIIKAKKTINLKEPIEVEAEVYLKSTTGEDEKIDVGQVYVEIFDDGLTYQKTLLTKTETGTYKGTIENTFPEGDYTLRFKTGNAMQDIPIEVKQYISNFGIFKIPKIDSTNFYLSVGFVLIVLISVILLILAKKKNV